MKKIYIILILTLVSEASFGQSKKELAEQNLQLKKVYNELAIEKANLEKQKKEIEAEKSRLAQEAKALEKEFLQKKKDLEKTKTEVTETKKQVEQSAVIINEKSKEIKVKDEDLSALAEAKKISDLEAENRKSTQKLLIVGLSLLFLVAVLLLYLFIARKKASKILEAEKKKSDTLLLNILPQEIAEELKNTSKTFARRYEMASVMFADIKNFTKISATLSPDVLIDELEYMFGAFDVIIQKYNIEKIKVIGDCYMCVGGIPLSNTTNANDIVNAALEIQEFMANMKKERLAKKQQVYELRIGINTGAIVAGVIGSLKFAYDVWGDTVNLASRVEAAGEPGKVNISSFTYECIKSDFPCIHRGKIDAKGKGAVDMYFVTGASHKPKIVDQKQPQSA